MASVALGEGSFALAEGPETQPRPHLVDGHLGDRSHPEFAHDRPQGVPVDVGLVSLRIGNPEGRGLLEPVAVDNEDFAQRPASSAKTTAVVACAGSST